MTDSFVRHPRAPLLVAFALGACSFAGLLFVELLGSIASPASRERAAMRWLEGHRRAWAPGAAGAVPRVLRCTDLAARSVCEAIDPDGRVVLDCRGAPPTCRAEAPTKGTNR